MNLRLMQLGDSALPIGGYSHSWGLEAAVSRGLVKDAATLERWARCWLPHTVGPMEGVVVAVACRAAKQANWDEVRRANELLDISLVPPTLRRASQDMGEQLLALAEPWPWAAENATALRHVGPAREHLIPARSASEGEAFPRSRFGLVLDQPVLSIDAWHHAPVFGTLAAAAQGRPLDAVEVYLHQAALGIIGAGVRAIPIGHTHGQQILARMHDGLCALAQELVNRDLDTLGSFAPAYEMLCDAQSHLYTRLFRS